MWDSQFRAVMAPSVATIMFLVLLADVLPGAGDGSGACKTPDAPVGYAAMLLRLIAGPLLVFFAPVR